ncbi:DUF7344 domain-containing protein [Halopiger xanaduensis]|uniref:DUF7344 domain-containing protein n=1 Tax=Halopiger xanaduensis (strain DSM 18323 / JCM 14033 / SH-6) TaxID=797210 RepID=F8D554_HALXS|nr:hypothetical protein [Halopiger xanaduensis]AEH36406.1 hypothetical protein Halxa_1778 [Halopiger xanaduensis SH-6]
MNTAEALTLLADTDRRRAVAALLETETTTIDALSERLADARRQDDAGVESDADRFERTKIGLIHDHLPRLADHGVLEYDARNGDVVLEDASDLEPYLAVDETTVSIAPQNE